MCIYIQNKKSFTIREHWCTLYSGAHLYNLDNEFACRFMSTCNFNAYKNSNDNKPKMS